MLFMLLPSPELSCADELTGRRTAAAVMADALTARLRNSLLVLIFVTSVSRRDLAGCGDYSLSTFQRFFDEQIPGACGNSRDKQPRGNVDIFHSFCSLSQTCKERAILAFANKLFVLWNRSTLLDRCPFTDVEVRISTLDSRQMYC